MELLREMHATLENCVNKIGESEDFSREGIDQEIVKFVSTAKKLETYLLAKQNEANSNPLQQIRELEKELAHKTFLIEKYTKLFEKWEETFRHMKEDQKGILENVYL